jgi:tetratricopeptide (TPR) repeat protein
MDNMEQPEPMWSQTEEDYADYEAKRRARIAELDAAIQREPSNASLYWERGREKIELGNWVHDSPDEEDNRPEGHRIMDEGLTDVEHAIALDPNNIEYLKFHASRCQCDGRLPQAIEDYGRLVELEPDNLNYRYTLADWQRQRQNYESAIANYTALIQMLKRRLMAGW